MDVSKMKQLWFISYLLNIPKVSSPIQLQAEILFFYCYIAELDAYLTQFTVHAQA